jgi:drug/metabolite transporter (DMT)-like permease
MPASYAAQGWTWAAVNVFFDVLGSIITKEYATHLSTWSINGIRFGSAAIGLAIGFAVGSIFRVVHDERTLAAPQGMQRGAWARIWVGTLLATFICPALSQFALFEMDISVYSTLMALTPVHAIICARLVNGEHATAKAVAGSILAFTGVAVMLLLD